MELYVSPLVCVVAIFIAGFIVGAIVTAIYFARQPEFSQDTPPNER